MKTKQNIPTKNKLDPRFIIGICLVIVGALVLLDSIEFISFDVPNIIFSFPAILIFIGTLILFKGNNKILGTLIFGVGTLLLLPRIFPWIFFDRHLTFPILIIAFGIYVLIRSRKSNYDCCTDCLDDDKGDNKKYDKDRLNDLSIFGGGQKIITSNNFKGGNITAIFGGSELDFINCKLAEGTVVIDVLAIFGGSTLIVPKEWNVVIDIFPLFGGFSNKIMRAPDAKMDMDRTLIIKGIVIFGGGEVKSY